LNIITTPSGNFGPSVRWEVGSGQSIIDNSANLITTGTWYLFTGTCDNSTGLAKLYRNGLLVSSAQVQSSNNTTVTSRAEVAVRDESFDGQGVEPGINGNVAVARIYNRALSDSEVLGSYYALISRVS